MASNNLVFSISLNNKAKSALDSLKQQVSSLKSGIQSLGSGISSTSSNLTNLKDNSTKTEKSMNTLGSTVSRIIGIFSGFKIVNTIFNTITSTIDQAINRIDTMDLFEQKMTMITGSAELATEALEQLKTSTKGTPYALDIAAKGVQNFVLRGMETQEAVDSINIWMDAVSAYGKGTNEQFESVIDAIAKMRTKGTVEMRYLNRLFAAGINPVQMYAQATGQAAEDVQTALSEKEISAKDFLDTVETAMREGTNGVLQIQGKAKELATTWAATLSNMRIAIARGWASIIESLDQAFLVIDPERGLKGLFKGFGEEVENIMGVIASGISKILPPIFQAAKKAFEYWNNYYFQPLREYFAEFVNPVKENMQLIRDTFNVEGEADINSLINALDYQGTGSLRDALLEVVMSFENLKKTARDTWRELSNNNQPEGEEKYTFNFDDSIFNFLSRLDNIIDSSQNGVRALVTEIYYLGQNIKNTFGAAIEIVFTLVGGFAELAVEIGSVVIPPAIELLANILYRINEILAVLIERIKSFLADNIPKLVDTILYLFDSLLIGFDELSHTPFVTSLSEGLQSVKDRLVGIYRTSRDYIGFLNNENGFTYEEPGSDNDKVVKIIENLRRTFKYTLEELKPLQEAIYNFFYTEIGDNKINDAFTALLDIVEKVTRYVSDTLPLITSYFVKFGVYVVNAIRPACEWLFKLFTDNIVPFGMAAVRAFVNISIAIEPLISAFGRLITTVAGFIIPPALNVFTFILNWIADHAQLVVGAITGIVAAFLTFKTITVVSDVLMKLQVVLLDGIIPAVANFFTVMTTQGIGAALMTIFNPVAMIPLAIAALIGLAAGLIYLYNTSDTARDKINHFIASFLSMVSGVHVGAGQVEIFFRDLGDNIIKFKDQIDSLLNKIDEFFDKFDALRKILQVFLKGPVMDFGGVLGSSEDIPVEEVYNPFKDLMSGQLQGMKIQMPNLLGNTEQWRATADEAGQAVTQSIEMNIPEVQANATATVQTLYSSFYDTMGANGPVDTSQITSNIDRIPIEGYEAGSGMGWNLVSGVNETQGAVLDATNNMANSTVGLLSADLTGDPTYLAGANFINTFNAGFQTTATSTYQMIAAFVNNCLVQLQAGFNNPDNILPTTIAASLTTLMSLISSKVEMYCKEINEKLTTCYNTFLNTVQTTFDDFVAKHDTTVKAIFPAFQNNIKAHLDDTYQKYVNYYDSVVKKLNDLSSYHYDIGSSMMTNLKNGIADTMPQVQSVEGELVQTLKNVFEQGMGINSPADKWIWYGQMMIAGLLLGLDSTKVEKFVNNMVNRMNESFKNGSFDPTKTVNFLSDKGTLDLIARVTGMDMGSMTDTISYPLSGTLGTITSYFGNRESPGGIGSTNHQGMDLAAATGTPILSALAGTVSLADWYGGYGNAVVVNSGNGLEIVYGHMSQILAKTGQQVNKGQQIGLVGSTGNSTGPHLHFEIRQNDVPIDPLPYLQGAGISAGNTLASALQNAYNAKHGIVSASNVAYNPNGGAAQWAPVVLQALNMLGQPASLLNGVLYAIESESGGNPNAINLWDSNAAAGHPSQGLLQTIPSTFSAYALPGYNTNITDPLSNILAGLNYMIQVYGGIDKVVGARSSGWYGYAVGTRYVPSDMLAMIHRGEAILPASQNPYASSGGNYLADLFSEVFNNTGINGLGFDLSALSGSGTSNNNINNNLNNVFNIHNDSDVNADRNVETMEKALHKLLSDCMRASGSR